MARKDGSEFQTSYVSAPIVDRLGRVTHWVTVVRDITDDLALREQLVRSERMSAVGEIIAGVVHELNDPLQATISALRKVLDDPATGPIRTEIERAHGETVRIDAIVQNLRAFVRSAPSERMVKLDGSPEVRKTDVRLYAYDGQLLLTAARLYQGQTTNFRTPGGGFAPVFVI